jgi:ribose transport system substrate-binding protein
LHLVRIIFSFVLGALTPAAFAAGEAVPAPSSVTQEMRQAVARATAHGQPWSGPRSGPLAKVGAKVAVVCEDLRNGGILSVAKAVSEAGKVIGWKIALFDAGGTPEGRDKAFAAAADARADGLIIIGADAAANLGHLKPFTTRRTPVVGWHVGPFAGPVPGSPVAMNVSTDPLEVARITASAAVIESDGRAGVVIFTDGNFAIAKAKADAMAGVIRACRGCTLLEVRDVAISKSAEAMPAVTKQLLVRHGARWTHALAINDIYFDYAAQELTRAGRASDSLAMLSAGDGSPSAFLRIKAGTFQTATVAEPLDLHGWQLVDELNRLLSGQPVTGYVAPVHLVTAENIAFDGGARLLYEPDNGYRQIYRHIWGR